MARVRKIYRNPGIGKKNYFLVDACFLANRFIDPRFAPDDEQKTRINACLEWWPEIDAQIQEKKARIYCPNVCVAETFKVLAKKYYKEHWFLRPQDLNNARKRLVNYITIEPRHLQRALNREIKFHDVEASRDIIITVDRFYEQFMKQKKDVQIADLILIATAKYIMDFYDIPYDLLHIITLDGKLVEGIEKIVELPNAYNPSRKRDSVRKIFVDNSPLGTINQYKLL